MKLTIKGAFVDAIDRVKSCIDYKPSIEKEITLDNDDSREVILATLNIAISFHIKDRYIEVVVPRSKFEIDAMVEDNNAVCMCTLKQLNRWCKNDEADKVQIETYLRATGEERILRMMDSVKL